MAYLYRHIRLDKNQPFYIGIGKKDNDRFRRAHDTLSRNINWKRVYSKTKIDVEILIDNISYDEAKKKEIEFISLYGRKIDGGILVNLTKGGDGVLGYKNPKLSERNKTGIWQGKKHTEETKKIMGMRSRGRKHSIESREKSRQSKIGMYDKEKNPNYRGIIYAYKDGIFQKECRDLCEAAALANIKSPSNISAVLMGKKPLCGGYYFTRNKLV